MRKYYGVLLILTVFILLIAGCKKDDEIDQPLEVVVDSLVIITTPDNIDYLMNQPLDLTGLEIKLYWSDNSTETISYSEFSEKGIKCYPVNGTILTTVTSYVTIQHDLSRKYDKQYFSVSDVRSIEINTAPLKTNFYIGDSLDLNGLTVNLIWQNDLIQEIGFSDFSENGIISSVPYGSRLNPPADQVVFTHERTGNSTAIELSYIETVTDIDNNIYKVLNIDGRVWMTENLKTTRYNDGTSISLVTDNAAWQATKAGGYCWYNNDEAANKKMGALYNWYSTENNNLCPTGWHVPSKEEIEHLYDYPGVYSHSLMAATDWIAGGGHNSTGYTALPGGKRDKDGVYSGIGEYACWWGSSVDEYDRGCHHFFADTYGGRAFDWKNSGKSIRCIKD